MCPSRPEICPTGPRSQWESFPPAAKMGWCWKSKVLAQPNRGNGTPSEAGWKWQRGDSQAGQGDRASVTHSAAQHGWEGRDRAGLSRKSANQNPWGYSRCSIASVGSPALGGVFVFLINCLFFFNKSVNQKSWDGPSCQIHSTREVRSYGSSLGPTFWVISRSHLWQWCFLVSCAWSMPSLCRPRWALKNSHYLYKLYGLQ